MEKRWTLIEDDKATTEQLRAALKIHPAICKILSQRGINTFDKAKDFFRPELAGLHEPWLMKDMDKAVDRILEAFDNEERIMVFGDYDVDGTTSVAMMYSFLKKNHPLVDFYIPHRYREGYGVSKAGIDKAKETGVTLIVALDCGIKSVELITYAGELGIDFIVCDHHLPDAELPPAVAILNAKQPDCGYPYKELCGCGVGFKLITAIAEVMGLPFDDVYTYIDLVATAIAADIVPLTGENRILAYYGIKKANENPNHGIRALAEIGGLKKELKIENLVFMIAPRVNAAGRMEHGRKAVELFVSESPEEAKGFAVMLHDNNSDRREADSTITAEAMQLIADNPSWAANRSTVLYQSHWHKGVVGIVASRVIESYYRPTVILTQSGEYAAGSARSVPGFNLYEAIHACREHLIGYGGHFAAAGMTLHIENVDAFRQKFEEVVSATITARQLVPELVIDAEIRLADIREAFYKIICQMEPFGPENLKPLFISRKVYDTGQSKLVKEEHLRVALQQDGVTIYGIGFNMKEKIEVINRGLPMDVVYRIDENEFNGVKSLQVRVVDLRVSEE
ncbi:MAG: single-stranded-DNA-specific exonuclease RecJ [Chitinophagaceae bacterium]|nr:MAG: single-stranded-DNA-specific exonuclease RecJ [Chitinophagaceae bacterium]